MPTDQPLTDGAFLEPGSATIEDFERLDLRVGCIIEAGPLEGACQPAWKLLVDFGPGGQKQSSAQLTRTYPDPDVLAADGEIPLLSVDAGAQPGQRIG